MFNRSYLGLGGLVSVGLIALTGCSSFEVDAASVAEFDTAALDAYMSDAKVDFKKPEMLVETSGERKSTVSGDYKFDHGHIEYASFAGEWVAKPEMTETGESLDSDDPMAGFAEGMADAFSEMVSMTLELKKDHTFEMVAMFFPIEGKWVQKGNSLILTPTKVMGQTEDEFKSMVAGNSQDDVKVSTEGFENMELRIADNGEVLVAIDDKSDDQPMVFRRK